MKSQFNALGLETEFIDVKAITNANYTQNDDIVADAVKAYNNLGLPVIATLRLEKSERYDYHAIVISGYRHKNGKVTELYVHDDQIGPFHKVLPNGNFSNWINDWVTKIGYNSINVDTLIIPIYPKLRLNFGRIYNIYLINKRVVEQQNTKHNTKITLELFLTSLNSYKNSLWKRQFPNKIDILQQPLPRFLWIIRLRSDKQIKDFIFDGTAVYAKQLLNITYDIK